MRKLLLLAFAAGLVLLTSASAQIYQFTGGLQPPPTPVGCPMTGIADLTNSCNNAYLLTGVLK